LFYASHGTRPVREGPEATPLDNSIDTSALSKPTHNQDQREDAHVTGDKTTLPPVRVETEFKERLVRYAASQERDVSWVIRKAIKEYLDRHEEGSLVQDPDR
jgi:ribbon-helix-helix CopG family protein